MYEYSESTAVVVAHFHPQGRVAKHLVEYLAYLQQHVTPHLILVSTCLSEEGKSQVEPYARVIQRDNVGYDFWSYKVGLDALPKDRPWKRLVILNSSIVITNPALLTHRLFLRPTETGLWGLTMSEEKALHLQSYCVSFEGEELLQSDVMSGWWSTMESISDRDQVIKLQEVGMSQYFHRKKIPIRSLFSPTPNQKLRAILRTMVEYDTHFSIPEGQQSVSFDLSVSRFLNPTHVMWDAIFEQFGIVKIDFLRKSLFASRVFSYADHLSGGQNMVVRDLIEDALK